VSSLRDVDVDVAKIKSNQSPLLQKPMEPARHLNEHAYHGYRSRKVAIGGFASAHCASFLSLPARKGVMITG